MIDEIKELINNSENIAIFFHVSPDGDAIGSGLALGLALKKLGKNVTVFSQDEVEERLNYLPIEEICYDVVSTSFDLAFVVDCGDIRRIGTMENVLLNAKNVINIDHHLNNTHFADFLIEDTKASSTCELVYKFISDLNIEFTKEIKLCLYTGIATDTGCFMYNINEKTHLIANKLMENMCDEIAKLNYYLFRETEFGEIKLLGEAINKLETYYNDQFAITDMTTKDLEKHNAKMEYTSSVVYLLSGLKDYKVVCVMCEEGRGAFKVSFRSNRYDVCALAKSFGGGGHKFAAGCKIYGSRNTVKKIILQRAKEFLCTEF